MVTMPSQPQVVKFGVFEVDLRAGEIRKAGVRQKLAGQPFQVLQVLLEHPQEIVTREELRERLWPGNTFVDYELALKKAVNRLREILGDSAGSPRFIETVPRRGYRFLGAVEAAERSVAVPVIAASPTGMKIPWTLTASLALALLAALLLGFNFDKLRTRIFAKTRSLEIRSIAVLPLENLSRNSEQEYFADGMTDVLITNLAQIGSLKVISRTSSMQYKQTKKPLAEIARELNVDAVIEGTVQRSGDRVRITAQLIDAANDRHLWAKSYDREIKDVLQLENDVAREITLRIGPVKVPPPAQPALLHEVPSEAYENYLRGRYRWNERSEKGLRAGIGHFQKAIELDPLYAQPYAGLADSYIMLANWGFLPASEGYPNAEAAARKALELDDQLAESQASLAYATLLYDWDWAGAESRFRRAIELNPNYATAHHYYSVFLMAAGRHSEAEQEIERARGLDPLSRIINSVVGWIYYEGRNYDKALEECQRTVEMDPNYPPSLLDLGSVYLAKGEYEKAIAQFERARALAGDTETDLSYVAQAYASAGSKAKARNILSDLEKSSEAKFVSPWEYALIYDALGDKNQALASLEKAADQHVGWVVLIAVDP